MISFGGAEPVNERGDLIIQSNGVCETQQSVAGSFHPHDKTPRGVIGVTKKEAWKKRENFAAHKNHRCRLTCRPHRNTGL